MQLYNNTFDVSINSTSYKRSDKTLRINVTQALNWQFPLIPLLIKEAILLRQLDRRLTQLGFH